MTILPDRRIPAIAPSLLSADFSRLREEIAAVEAAGADLLHVDVMDGHFVPNITIGPPVVAAMKRVSTIPLDVHLMISDPDRYLHDFRQAGAGIITVHQEACIHLNRTLQSIRETGALAGVSINPATPVSQLEHALHFCDLVLIMSVNPGFGGQKFIAESVAKVRTLREMALRKNASILIEIDGGITVENAREVFEAGVDILVAGSAIFGSGDYTACISSMRKSCGERITNR